MAIGCQEKFSSYPRRKSQLTLIWILSCLLGNCFQVYQISGEYFQYDINTNVHLIVEKELDFPSITQCFDLPYIFKWENASREVRQQILEGLVDIEDDNVTTLRNEVRKTSFISKLVMAAKIQTIFKPFQVFNLTLSANEMFGTRDTAGVYDPQLNRPELSPLNKFMNVVAFIKNTYKCFRMDLKESYRRGLNYYRIKRQTLKPAMVFMVTHNDGIMKTFHISEILYIVNGHKRSLRSGFYSILQIAISLGRATYVTHDKYHTKLLPYPYATNCRNYSQNGYDSQGDCFEECVLEETLRHNNGTRLPPLTTLHRNETKRIIQILDLYVNESINTIVNQVDQLCDRLCHQKDCVSDTYIPRILSTSHADGNISLIQTCIPISPVVRTTCYPQLTKTQYLTDVVSTLGFWTGVSLLGIFNFVRQTSGVIATAFCGPVEEKVKQLQKRVHRPERLRRLHADPVAMDHLKYRFDIARERTTHLLNNQLVSHFHH